MKLTKSWWYIWHTRSESEVGDHVHDERHQENAQKTPLALCSGDERENGTCELQQRFHALTLGVSHKIVAKLQLAEAANTVVVQ